MSTLCHPLCPRSAEGWTALGVTHVGLRLVCERRYFLLRVSKENLPPEALCARCLQDGLDLCQQGKVWAGDSTNSVCHTLTSGVE